MSARSAGLRAIAVVSLLVTVACSAHTAPRPGVVTGSIEQCTGPGTKPLNSPGLATIHVYDAADVSQPVATSHVQTTATERNFRLSLAAGSYRIGVAAGPTVIVVVRPGETTHDVLLPFLCT